MIKVNPNYEMALYRKREGVWFESTKSKPVIVWNLSELLIVNSANAETDRWMSITRSFSNLC